MIKLDDIHIISIIETGTGFGVHAETGENVFIPASVVNGARLQVGEQVGAVLVPNMAEMRDKTPWRAVRVPREGVELAPLPDVLTGHDVLSGASLDTQAFGCIEAASADHEYRTTAEVALELNQNKKMVGNALQRLFNAGRISRAEVYHRVGQSRPSFILWTLNSSDFVGGEEEDVL
jgi:hypothetical protein